jgi:hypothetical protein
MQTGTYKFTEGKNIYISQVFPAVTGTTLSVSRVIFVKVAPKKGEWSLPQPQNDDYRRTPPKDNLILDR